MGRGGGPPLRWAVAGAGYALLALVWVFASPFGAAPDEPAHTVRAAAAGGGQWQGGLVAPYQRGHGQTQAEADLLNQQAQQFTIPADLAATDPCFVGRPDQSAACANATAPPPATVTGTVKATTYETTAPPGIYTVAGVAMRLPVPGVAPGYLGRLVLAVVCALLLAGAAWAAGGRGSLWPLAGVALAASPMVLFLGTAVGTAGIASAAAICFMSGVLAFWFGPPRRGLALVIGVSGAILALSSAAGALAIVALIAAVLPLVHLRRLTESGAVLASAVVTGALVAGVALALDRRPLPAGPVDLFAAASTALQAAPRLLQEAAGVFGRSDVPLPPIAYAIWGGMLVIGASTALVLGRWRDRLAMALVAVAAAAAATVAYGFILSPVGWDLRGSFLLPILVGLPVLTGFVLHAAGVRSRADVLLIGIAVVGVQLLALWENARRYAVGTGGPLNFLDAARWSPPGGWMLWMVLAAAGGALVLLAMLPLSRRESDEEGWGPLVVVDPITVGR